jgi:hypothetical protein
MCKRGYTEGGVGGEWLSVKVKEAVKNRGQGDIRITLETPEKAQKGVGRQKHGGGGG